MGLLKGVPALLSPDLLHTLSSMGHGDELVLADANYPARYDGTTVVAATAVAAAATAVAAAATAVAAATTKLNNNKKNRSDKSITINIIRYAE